MSVEYRDYYKTLGVERNATEAEIKKAFRRLARIYHPDVAKDKVSAEQKFREINEAYDVLSDPEKRRKYDRLGANWQESEFGSARPSTADAWSFGHGGRRAPRPAGGPSFRFGGTTGFSDFFEQFFGSGGATGTERFDDLFDGTDSGSAAHRARLDTEADLLVTLDEVLGGGERLLQLERNWSQGGSASEKIRVRIPRGVREGQRLRVAARGETGADGHAGDLYLRVRLAAHPDYRVDGDNLVYDLALAPWEAVLGTTIRLPLPGGGRAAVRIPAGTQPGQQLRLRGRGLPRADSGAGDLLANVVIALPEQLSPEERQLWEKLASHSRFHPRGNERG